MPIGFCTSGSWAKSVAWKPGGSFSDFSAFSGEVGCGSPFSLLYKVGNGSAAMASDETTASRAKTRGRSMIRNLRDGEGVQLGRTPGSSQASPPAVHHDGTGLSPAH